MGWQEYATTKPRRLDTDYGKWPKAGVAAELGQSRLVVLDADRHVAGIDGVANLDKWQEEHGTLPDTLTQGTKRNGRHYIFRVPEGCTIGNDNTGKFLAGVDVKAKGGLAVLAGTPGYSILNNVPIADAPQFLIDALEASQAVSKDIGPTTPLRETPAGYESLSIERRAFCDGETDTIVNCEKAELKRLLEGPYWNDPHYSFACRMYELAYRYPESYVDPAMADELIDECWKPADSGNWNEEAIAKTRKSALANVLRKRDRDGLLNFKPGEVDFKEDEPKPEEEASTLIERLNKAFKDASKIEPKDTEWAWEGYVQANSAALLVGDGSVGKGVLSVWQCAQLSRGTLPGDYYGRPVKTAFMSLEENMNEDTVPRLIANGADLDMISIFNKDEFDFSLTPDNIEMLCQWMVANDIKVLFIDPIIAFFPGNKKDNEIDVQSVLHPLNKACQRYRITIIGLRHIRKGNTTFEDATMGSKAWRNSVRSMVGIFKHPNDPNLRVVGNMKMNNAADTDSAHGFRFESVDVAGLKRNYPKLVWEKGSYSFDTLMQMHGLNSSEEKSKIEKTSDERLVWLIDFFKVRDWEALGRSVVADGKLKFNLSEASVRRIATNAGVVTGKQGGDGMWRLPPEHRDPLDF